MGKMVNMHNDWTVAHFVLWLCQFFLFLSCSVAAARFLYQIVTRLRRAVLELVPDYRTDLEGLHVPLQQLYARPTIHRVSMPRCIHRAVQDSPMTGYRLT